MQKNKEIAMDEYSGLLTLSEYEYKIVDLDDPERIEFEKKRNASLEEYRRQAMELWNDSCTECKKRVMVEKIPRKVMLE
jgi:hypothetical protein